MFSARFATAFVVALVCAVQTSAADVTVTGYLADLYCINGVDAPDGANMITGPEDHSVMCALLDKCKTTGFTIHEAVSGQTSYGKMTNFTPEANTRAIAYLETLPLLRQNLKVKATGMLFANGTLDATMIMDDAQVELKGMLADLYCVNGVNAPDGANMITGPDQHSVHCALLTMCQASGYTILNFTAGAGITEYRPMVNLTSAGSALAITYLKTLDGEDKNLYVQATGTHLVSGLFAATVVEAMANAPTEAPPVTATPAAATTTAASATPSGAAQMSAVAAVVFAIVVMVM